MIYLLLQIYQRMLRIMGKPPGAHPRHARTRIHRITTPWKVPPVHKNTGPEERFDSNILRKFYSSMGAPSSIWNQK
jgi:hypothetical protein